jgi:phosphoribosylformimino-5-aminoimidazole carboxamide ribotide isomerase
MKIYPAIDILGGKAVRLRQGLASEATTYGDPLTMATRWQECGAEWLHIVDLDGAFEGQPRNIEAVRGIAAEHPSLKIQLGGGIRNMNTVETLLGAGIHRVVLGTSAVQDRDFVKAALATYADRIVIGIDARDGKARIGGWTKDSTIGAVELAQALESIGARLVVYTDISRDGELQGPNIEATLHLIRNTGLSVIASGGVSAIDDVDRLSSLSEPRLDGVIIGKALYEGRIQLEEALTYAR